MPSGHAVSQIPKGEFRGKHSPGRFHKAVAVAGASGVDEFAAGGEFEEGAVG